jgi:thiamine biosynthesis protein ThiS
MSAATAGTIEISVNGEPRAVAAGVTIAALLDELGLKADRVAVERNRAIAPRTQWSAALEAGDRIEIVHFVGGG